MVPWMSHVASSHLVLNNHLIREHFSSAPIDFEEKPITMDSLNEQDLIVRQQISVRNEVHPLYSGLSSSLCSTKRARLWRRINIKSLFALLFIASLYSKSKELVVDRHGTNVASLFLCPTPLADSFPSV